MTSRLSEPDMVNLIISMTYDISTGPKPFLKQGYALAFLEREFNINMDGKIREVKFDVVLNNMYKNQSIALECKSGHSEDDQLNRYSKLNSEQMVRVGGVSSHEPAKHTTDIALVINDDNKENILHQTEGYSFAILSCTSPQITIRNIGRGFSDHKLQMEFGQAINYDADIPSIIQVGTNTPIDKFVPLVVRALVAQAVSGNNSCTINDIAPNVFASIPGVYPSRIGLQLETFIVGRIKRILQYGCPYEWRGYITWNAREQEIAFDKLSPKSRPGTLEEFKNRSTDLEERLRTKGEVMPKYRSRQADKPIPKNQTHFLDSLASDGDDT